MAVAESLKTRTSLLHASVLLYAILVENGNRNYHLLLIFKPITRQLYNHYCRPRRSEFLSQRNGFLAVCCKFFMYVTKTSANLTTYRKKLENYNATIIFEIDIDITYPQSIQTIVKLDFFTIFLVVSFDFLCHT